MDPNAVDISAEMQPARTESAPVEPNAPDPQSAPVGESDQPEKKVSETVPYERFKEVNDRLHALESSSYSPPPSPAPAYAPPSMAQLDPEVLPAVRQAAWQVMEEHRAAEFIARHGQELQDPILRGAVGAIIQDANAKRQTISQEDALAEAKRMLEERATPKVAEAQSQGFSEGQNIARAKQQASAVGDTTKSAPPVDPDKMSAAEFAKFMNIPRHTA